VAGFFKVGLIATFLVALAPLILPRGWTRFSAAVLLIVGLGTMGAGEWLREAGRKPYTIDGYLYSTGMRVDQQDWYAENGMAAGTLWISRAAADDPVRLGRDLYLAWCQPCHTMDGYNGLRPFLSHWNEETVTSLVPRLEHLRALMPPWYGTEAENAALTAYLMTQKPATAPPLPDDPLVGGQAAFALSCGLCHTVNGYRSLADSFTGMSAEEIDEFLDEAGDLADEMPGYFGSDEQRKLLIGYLELLGKIAEEAEAVEGSES